MLDIMKFIKEERIKQGITQNAVAYAAMIHPATLCMWEKYKYSPKFEPIISILDFLGYEIVIKKKEHKPEPQTKTQIETQN